MVDRYGYRRDEIPHYSSHHHPSFSSTLLDAIYRSIDQGEEEAVYREAKAAMRNKNQSHVTSDGHVFTSEEEMANFHRACIIDKWIEKKASENTVVLQRNSPRKDSSWSSSDSSAGFSSSSSEAESFPVQRPKPVRTGFDRGGSGEHKPKKHEEDGFLKAKSRALKIYGDFKKVKQPISPGGKLAGFLNSLFTVRKSKNGDDSASSSLKSSTCSSASSFSRSCLSKTPSSSRNGAAKRSVRFSPVSVIVDQDSGHKSSLRQDKISNNYDEKLPSRFECTENNNNNINSIRSVINEEVMLHVMEKNRRVEEVARDLLRNYQRKNNQVVARESEFCDFRKSRVENQIFDHDFEEEEDDDAASYASSDLFELDNLSAIGMERYREELPVYETTHLHDTNRVIM